MGRLSRCLLVSSSAVKGCVVEDYNNAVGAIGSIEPTSGNIALVEGFQRLMAQSDPDLELREYPENPFTEVGTVVRLQAFATMTKAWPRATWSWKCCRAKTGKSRRFHDDE